MITRDALCVPSLPSELCARARGPHGGGGLRKLQERCSEVVLGTQGLTLSSMTRFGIHKCFDSGF